MISDTILAIARLKGGMAAREIAAAKMTVLERAATLLRTHCPNADGSPEHSEQTAQWTACGSCEECRLAATLEGIEVQP